MITMKYKYYLSRHWNVLLLCISVVLIHIQHDDSIRQSKCCISICEWLSISPLQYQCH